MPPVVSLWLDIRAALNLGIHLGLADIRTDEFCAMLILEVNAEEIPTHWPLISFNRPQARSCKRKTQPP